MHDHHLHGAPYDPGPGPWPYLAVVALAAILSITLIISYL